MTSVCLNTALKRSCLQACIVQHTISRNTVVFKRRYPPPLVPLSKPLDSRKLKEKHYVYDIVENTCYKPIPDIDCVLTTHVDGIGSAGEVVTVKRKLFRKELLPSGAAVYASPENIAYYQSIAPTIKRTPHALQTYRYLCGLNLPIPMNINKEWTLTESHVQVALRQIGVWVENLDAIILPDDPSLTNETSENTLFEVKVKVNSLDEACVRCYIQPYSTDESVKAELPPGLQLPLHRDPDEVRKELLDKALYYGTFDVYNDEQKAK